MNQQLKEQLQECKTLNQMWMRLGMHYDLNKELGTLGKAAVIKNLPLLLKATGTKEK